MAKTFKIGKYTKEQQLKASRRGSREAELEDSNGWTAKHKVHKSKKDKLHRNRKHKGRDF